MSHIPAGPPPPGFPPSEGFPPTGGPALRPTWGLGIALTVLLCLVIATDALALGADLNMRAVLGSLATTTEQQAHRADTLYGVTAILQGTLVIPTAVVFIIWFHRSRKNAEHYTRDVCTLGSGWAIGSWFIPIGNLWLPFRVAKETWQSSAQSAPDGSWRKVSIMPVRAWWLLWVLTLVIGRIANKLYEKAELPDTIRVAVTVVALADLLDIAAAVLAILFVRKLSRMQQIPAAPYAVAPTGPAPYTSA
ncbi:DUF4328 domain-containing protein [Streptomyces monomycini]|uniref:DUF4328 domain-containing protein n=1 Tax=Streptomyces monomycini TaxID=371720 RepID=UPI001EEB78D3|nr:DUF4328 domain-containing protein [Streptomyces monomycini]